MGNVNAPSNCQGLACLPHSQGSNLEEEGNRSALTCTSSPCQSSHLLLIMSAFFKDHFLQQKAVGSFSPSCLAPAWIIPSPRIIPLPLTLFDFEAPLVFPLHERFDLNFWTVFVWFCFPSLWAPFVTPFSLITTHFDYLLCSVCFFCIKSRIETEKKERKMDMPYHWGI